MAAKRLSRRSYSLLPYRRLSSRGVPWARQGGNSANARLCQHGGWATLIDSTATPFASQDECVSYGAHRGVI